MDAHRRRWSPSSVLIGRLFLREPPEAGSARRAGRPRAVEGRQGQAGKDHALGPARRRAHAGENRPGRGTTEPPVAYRAGVQLDRRPGGHVHRPERGPHDRRAPDGPWPVRACPSAGRRDGHLGGRHVPHALLGDKTPTGGNYYIQVKGDPAVYTVQSFTGQHFHWTTKGSPFADALPGNQLRRSDLREDRGGERHGDRGEAQDGRRDEELPAGVRPVHRDAPLCGTRAAWTRRSRIPFIKGTQAVTIADFADEPLRGPGGVRAGPAPRGGDRPGQVQHGGLHLRRGEGHRRRISPFAASRACISWIPPASTS